MRSDPLVGTWMGGRYRIVSRIGIGGMGTVYRAEQRGLGRPVALKVLKAELVSDRETVRRFQREAKAMSMLVHPNTVRVFDFGEDPGGHLYLAMELLEGELLSTKLEREGALDVREAIGIVQQILRSLNEAHAKGLIHRDLKPDNIFLARVEGHNEPVVKVLDFGIAKVFRDDAKPLDQLETQAGTVFGTPRYMSPEQAQGKSLDQRSDLYSVGVILFQLLSGEPPFVDEDAVVVMAKHIKEEIPLVTEVAPERPIPPSLAQIVKRALEKEPAKRFSTAQEFEQALAAVIPDIEREIRRRSGAKHRLPRMVWDRKYVPHAVATAVTLLGLIGAVIVAAIPAKDREAGQKQQNALESPSVSPVTQSSPGAPPQVAPVATATRRVFVDTRPSGAEVWLGDSRVGRTP
ncbi:MAG: serine/threonine-protein kinase, partial [Sandaracinaceae bacterium]|nr:serine/threonine-protein kinase [Sandaracinaceae bacterium]